MPKNTTIRDSKYNKNNGSICLPKIIFNLNNKVMTIESQNIRQHLANMNLKYFETKNKT